MEKDNNETVPVLTKNPISITIPGMPVSVDPVVLVNGILDCYKNVEINREEQRTRREQVREQSRVYITAIEADTKKFHDALERVSGERIQLVMTLCEVIKKDDVDESSLQICKMILDYLTNNNPMNAIGQSNLSMLGRKD